MLRAINYVLGRTLGKYRLVFFIQLSMKIFQAPLTVWVLSASDFSTSDC